MKLHSYPPSQRVKLALWRLLNDAVDLVRGPICDPVVLLATGGSSSDAEVNAVEARLRFLLDHLENEFEIRRVERVSLLAYLRNAAVTTAYAGTLNSFALDHLRWAADLDHNTNPVDGWDLMDLGSALRPRAVRRTTEAVGRRTFVDRMNDLRADGRPVYLFGTGPSLEQAGDRSFADGATIVCNTIVKDPELWHHLAPVILTAGDAIYHFGHNAHSRAFRADALRRLQESSGRTLFVYPAMFDVIVRSEFRDVQSLLVPIPFGEHTDITVDLTKRFSFPRVDNVLNALLLPLGCTLSHEVRLWGFDGRAPTDTGFWANSSRQAYPELMQCIQDAHPAFFANKIPKGNETDYVKQVHGDFLNERLTEAEHRGFAFRMLHTSWTPTLQQRYRG